MLIAAAGDAHGEFDGLYDAVARLEEQVGRTVACVLHVGDFGVWPDAEHLDEATRRHGDHGGFRRLLDRGNVPRRTIFIAGNHEDFDYLQRLPSRSVLDGLEFLPWGEVTTVEHAGERLRVGGVGGCFGARDYSKELLTGWTRRHYTRHDLRRLRLASDAVGGLEVLLLHEPPAGEATELHAPPGFKCRSWTLVGEGQAELLASLRPRVCFTGHLHARIERSLAGVRVVGLHKIPVRGSVLLVEIPTDGPVQDMAEWGGAPARRAVVEEAARDGARDPFGESALATLRERLAQWSTQVLQGRTLDRDARKRLHARLRDEPLRALCMGALTGADPGALAARIDDGEERAEAVRRWLAAPLPEPSTLRDVG
jgi:hypothetical protein